MYKTINITIGAKNIFKLNKKLSFIKRNIVSDKIIRKIPNPKIINLDFWYSLFSLVNIVRNIEVNINTGIYNGTANLLYNS